MNHKGIDYSLVPAGPGCWRWEFVIVKRVATGSTQTRLPEIAKRRVQAAIDRKLRLAAEAQAGASRRDISPAALQPDTARRE
jgi:hypothetical protein